MGCEGTEGDRRASGELNNELVERCVEEMADIYAMLRGLTVKGARRSEHHGRWAELARELLTRGVNPRRYVRWAYDFYRRTNPEVYPQMICSLKTLKIFSNEHPDYKAEMRLQIGLQADTLRVQLGIGRTPEDILMDSYLELGPVIRYALACRVRSACAEQLKAAAELEMACEPLYRELLGDLLRVSGVSGVGNAGFE